ncbi:MAG: GntR family transcriptional regulator [Bacillota bacterium]|nr:GntR family transcriptional regulator [Bacillota bacterium]
MIPDKNSVVPLYHQIKEGLREEIEAGLYQPGDLLPPEHELCKRYGVSRITVRQAVLDLAREGLVDRKRGKGTFVCQPKIQQDLLGFYDFTRQLEATGREQTVRVLSVERVESEAVATWLGLPRDEPLVRIMRLRIVDDEPLILEKTFVSARRFPGIEREDFSSTPVYYRMITERFGVALGRAVKFLEPVLVDAYASAFLGVKKGSPGLLVVRVTYAVDGTPVVVTKWLVRGDRCRHYVEVGPHPRQI